MKILILGSGVVGVTSAWYLNQTGHDVTVLDRQPGPGLETSYANAGQLSFGYSSPWAAPGVPFKAIKWLFQKHAPLAIRPTTSLQQYCWMWQMMQNCTTSRYDTNKGRMERISEYSRESIDLLREQTGIEYEGRQQGTTQLFRTHSQVEAAQKDIKVLEQYGVPCELLDRDAITRAEPALEATKHKFVGALRTPNDQTGDCQIFTQKLADMAAAAGVEFRYNTTITQIQRDGKKITGIQTDQGVETADHYIVALGPYSPGMIASLGMHLPVYPLKGYSLTLPIRDESKAPQSTIMDESHKVAITRFNDRIRVGGMAEIKGYDLSLNPKRRETLEMVVNDIFPGGGNAENAIFWTGLRPATPDGTPVIGATPYENLYLNTGHGTLGWTMSAGSARYLADIINNETPDIDTEGLDIFRYRGHTR